MKQSFGEWLDETWNEPLEADWPTKHEGLNRLFNGGFRRQHLLVLGARPGVGKTTWMVDQAMALARRGIRIGICSVERPAGEIIVKACTNYSGGDPRPDEMVEELSNLPIWIDDAGAGLTVARIRRMVEDDPIDILFIDYLQLLGHERNWATRNAELDAIVQEIQALHKEYNIQIVLLSQLNRGVESRRYKDEHARPEIYDLRDSGAIEQTADEIILMHRDDLYREFPTNDGATELIVAKNRMGPTGTVRVTFYPEDNRFTE